MAVKLVEDQLKPKYKPNDPTSYQICDFFEDYFPHEIEQHLRELNTTYPLMGLRAQIEAGEITYGQWLLYTTVCLSGQITNGGVEQFFENCPGLIDDAAAVLRDYALPGFGAAYDTSARPLLDLISLHQEDAQKSKREDLAIFWKEFEIALDQSDIVAASKIDAACYSPDRDTNPKNWFNDLETRVLGYVLENPEEYRQMA